MCVGRSVPFYCVLDYSPLQQGLRLSIISLKKMRKWVLDYSPLQQGLRRFECE